MTREEEKYCLNCCFHSHCAFVKRELEDSCQTLGFFSHGYEAAIDKACEWLKENITYDDCGGNMEWVISFTDQDELITDFRKVMEG